MDERPASAWRLIKTRHAATAFNGEGARLFGGRWNSVGTPMVYLSTTLSLAALENLVHMSQADLSLHHSQLPVFFEKDLVADFDLSLLPPDWTQPTCPLLQTLGDCWAQSQGSVLLRVPSCIVPHEYNFLFNPLHPDAPKVVPGKATAYAFDPRLGLKSAKKKKP